MPAPPPPANGIDDPTGHGREAHAPGGEPLAHLRWAARAATAEAGVPAWFVGGCVRDALLGRECADLDVTVGGDPKPIALRAVSLLRERLGPGHRLGLGCLDAEAGLWRVVADGAYLDLLALEGPLTDDLARRDLTLNAMALPVTADTADELVDPLGGLADLRAGVLRSPRRENLTADPVRVLRIARFAAGLALPIEAETRRWITEAAPLLSAAPGERIGYEIVRALGADRSAGFARLLAELEILAAILPEVAALAGLVQGGYHHLDAYEHSLETLRIADAWLSGDDEVLAPLPVGCSRAMRAEIARVKLPWVRSRPALLRLAALLHDIGKPTAMTTDDDGRVRFSDHPRLGADLVGALAERLRLSRGERHYLRTLVREHMRPCMVAFGARVTDRAYGRLLRDLGDLTPDTCALSLADRQAARGPATTEEALTTQTDTVARIVGLWQESKRDGTDRPPLLRGKQVMELLRAPAGPEIGRVLRELRAAQLAGEVTTVEQAREFVRRRGTESDA